MERHDDGVSFDRKYNHLPTAHIRRDEFYARGCFTDHFRLTAKAVFAFGGESTVVEVQQVEFA